MRKSFEAKIYEPDGTFVRTVPVSDVISDFRFSSSLNSGPGDAEMELDRPFDDSTYSNGQFLKIIAFSDNYPNGKTVFSGQISRVRRLYSAGVEKVAVSALGPSALLSDVLYEDSGDGSFSKNQEAGLTVKDIIDKFDAKFPGGWISYSSDSVEDGPVVNIEFDNLDSLAAIKKCADATGYSFSISPDGEVSFFVSTIGTHHKPTLQKDVQSVTVNEDAETVVNRYVLEWLSGTVTSEDAASQAAYGVKELFESDSSILNSATAQDKADALIADRKDPKRKTSLVLNSDYGYAYYYDWDDSDTWNDDAFWVEFQSLSIESVMP